MQEIGEQATTKMMMRTTMKMIRRRTMKTMKTMKKRMKMKTRMIMTVKNQKRLPLEKRQKRVLGLLRRGVVTIKL